MEDKKIVPNFEIVKFEETEFYDATELTRLGIKKVYGIYLYDKNQVTFCCELTPSYCLYYVDFCYDNSSDLTDVQCEEAYDWLVEANSGNEEVEYFHCSDIDVFPKEDRREWNPEDKKYEFTKETEDEYNKLRDDMISEYRMNPCW